MDDDQMLILWQVRFNVLRVLPRTVKQIKAFEKF